MSPSIKSFGFFAGLAVLAVGGALATRILSQDAFLGYNQKSEDPNVGVRMKDVEMRVYDGTNLVSESHVDSIDVMRDRQSYLLYGVKGYTGTGKERIDFSSSKGSYDAVAQQLQFESGMSLKNKDFDILAPAVLIDEKSKLVSAKGAIVGKAYGGNLKTSDFKFNQATGQVNTGAVKFQGKLPGVLQDGSPVKTDPKKGWDIESGPTQQRGAIRSWEGAFLATDGEVIIRGENGGRWDTKTDVVSAKGKVYYFSEQSNMVADGVTIYRKERRAVLEGNIRMLIKRKDQGDMTQEIPPFRPDVPEDLSANRPPAPLPGEAQQTKDLDNALRSAENVRDYPAIFVADRIEYWYAKGARRAKIDGKPEVLQDFPGGRWRRVAAHSATWDGQTEIVKMLSREGQRDVHLKTSIGDDVRWVWWSGSTKEGETEYRDWDGYGAKGRFMADPDEEEGPPATPPATATGTTGTPGT